MYKPEANLFNIRNNWEAREVFEEEALKKANKEFGEFCLIRTGFNSADELKESLRKEPEQDLRMSILTLRDEAVELFYDAMEPNLSPEDSFGSLVDAHVAGKYIQVYGEVIAEIVFERSNDVQTQLVSTQK